MDINHHSMKLSNDWDLDQMAMEEHMLQVHDHHHQIPFDYIWPDYPNFQHHHIPSSFPTSSTTHFVHQIENPLADEEEIEPEEELGAMKEMIYKIAAMQPVDIDPTTVRKPKRRNVRISDDPQSIAARHRRERISEKIRILQRLVPGGMKMDTASMLDEAIRYFKFLKRQIRLLQSGDQNSLYNIGGNPDMSLSPENWPFPPQKASHGSTSTSVDPPAASGPGHGF